MDSERVLVDGRQFLAWLCEWYATRPVLALEQLIDAAGGAAHVAVMAVDVTTGFCSRGPLASDRVGGIVEPIRRLLLQAHALGVQHFILPQDTHSPDAVEFGSFPPHCVRGTDEPVTVPELQSLPFSDRFFVIEKDSISSDIGTGLDAWLASHPEVTAFLVVGDCTDFCVYQLAMHLRLRANALKLQSVRVVVPVDCVDTFDLPVEAAQELGVMPHPGDVMHLVFLFSMAQNGVEIVRGVV